MAKQSFKFSGDILQIRRKLLNYSLQQIADKVGVTKACIHHWENGKSYPESKHLNKLAQIIQMKPERMLLKDFSERAKTLNVR